MAPCKLLMLDQAMEGCVSKDHDHDHAMTCRKYLGRERGNEAEAGVRFSFPQAPFRVRPDTLPLPLPRSPALYYLPTSTSSTGHY